MHSNNSNNEEGAGEPGRNSTSNLPTVLENSQIVLENLSQVSETNDSSNDSADSNAFLSDNNKILSLTEIQHRLRSAEEQTGVKTAVIYLVFAQKTIGTNSLLVCPSQSRNLTTNIEKALEQPTACGRSSTDTLEILVVTGNSEPIHLSSQINRQQLFTLIQELVGNITTPRKRNTTSYLASSQKLYQALITPIQADLAQQGIQHLILIPDGGLRSRYF